MSHPSETELHDIAYGFLDEPAHVRECDMCEAAIVAIRAEQDVLRRILKEPPARSRFHWTWGATAAAAALVVGLIVFLTFPILMPGEDEVAQDEKKTESLKSLVARFAKGDKSVRRKIQKAGMPAMLLLREHLDTEAVLDLMQDIRIDTTPVENRALAAKIDTMMVDMDFQDSRVSDVVSFMTDFAVPTIVDPSDHELAAKTMTMKIRNGSLRHALEVVCAEVKADFAFHYGWILIAKPERLWPKVAAPVKPLTNDQRKRAKALIPSLGARSLDDREEAAEELAKYGPGVLDVLRPSKLDPDPEIRGRVRDLIRRLTPKPKGPIFGLPAAEMQEMSDEVRAAYEELKDGQTVTINVSDLSLMNVFKLLGNIHDSKIEFLEGAKDGLVSLSFGDRPFWDVITLLTQAFGLDYIIEEKKIIIGNKADIRKRVK